MSAEVPFSSEPEMERPHARRARHARARRARRVGGARSLASGSPRRAHRAARGESPARRAAGGVAGAARGDQVPPGLVARGIAVLEEGLREEAIDTIAFLVREGVQIKIISGDGLATVQAVALAARGARRRARNRRPGSARRSRRARRGGTAPHRLRARAPGPEAGAGAGAHALGQVRRDGRRRRERRARTEGGAAGHRNGQRQPDGEGRGRPRPADERVLDRAASDRGGRRILRNTHRVARLFVTKSVYSAFLVAMFAIVPIAYPYLPRHLTIVSTLTVGLPAFFLALASSEGPVREPRDSSATSRGSRCRSAPWSRPSSRPRTSSRGTARPHAPRGAHDHRRSHGDHGTRRRGRRRARRA